MKYILNLIINDSFNVKYHTMKIDDNTKCVSYPLLSSLNISLITHVMSALLYDIVKLSEWFPDSSILNIKHHYGTYYTRINIHKQIVYIYIYVYVYIYTYQCIFFKQFY